MVQAHPEIGLLKDPGCWLAPSSVHCYLVLGTSNTVYFLIPLGHWCSDCREL